MRSLALNPRKHYKYSKNNVLMKDNKFDNYLLDIALPDLESQNNGFMLCDLYIDGNLKSIKNIIGDIKKEFPKNTLQIISNKINCASSTIRCWLAGCNHAPLLKIRKLFEFWKKVCHKTDAELNIEWDKLFKEIKLFSAGANSRLVKLPKRLSNDLAYLMGFLLADGYIKSQSKLLKRNKYPEYSVAFYDNSKEFLKKINKIMVSEFDANCNLHYAEDKKGSWYCLRSTSKPIHRFFTEVLKIPSGYKQGRIVVPEIIKESSVSIQKAFIAGFCDGEGCVGISTKNPYFEVVQVSYTNNPPQILIWISEKLNELGISVSKPQKGSGFWRIRTGSQKVINNYYSLISSRHNDKIPKFKKVKRFSYAELRKKNKRNDRA